MSCNILCDTVHHPIVDAYGNLGDDEGFGAGLEKLLCLKGRFGVEKRSKRDKINFEELMGVGFVTKR